MGLISAVWRSRSASRSIRYEPGNSDSWNRDRRARRLSRSALRLLANCSAQAFPPKSGAPHPALTIGTGHYWPPASSRALITRITMRP